MAGEEMGGPSLGQRVQIKREADRLSLRALGGVTGVGFTTIKRIEDGRCMTPSRDVEYRLRRWLGDDIPPDLVSPHDIDRAHALGRAAAQAFGDELIDLLMRTPRQEIGEAGNGPQAS